MIFLPLAIHHCHFLGQNIWRLWGERRFVAIIGPSQSPMLIHPERFLRTFSAHIISMIYIVHCFPHQWKYLEMHSMVLRPVHISIFTWFSLILRRVPSQVSLSNFRPINRGALPRENLSRTTDNPKGPAFEHDWHIGFFFLPATAFPGFNDCVLDTTPTA